MRHRLCLGLGWLDLLMHGAALKSNQIVQPSSHRKIIKDSHLAVFNTSEYYKQPNRVAASFVWLFIRIWLDIRQPNRGLAGWLISQLNPESAVVRFGSGAAAVGQGNHGPRLQYY